MSTKFEADDLCREWIAKDGQELSLEEELPQGLLWVKATADRVAGWQPKKAWLADFLETGASDPYPSVLILPVDGASEDDRAHFVESVRNYQGVDNAEDYWGEQFCFYPTDD